jgi:vacuolar-type H+-ATPase subunit E/Vma4
MGLTQLLAALEQDAHAAAESVLAAARSTGERVEREARERRERQRSEFAERRDAALAEETERVLADTRRRARARVLEARQQLLERVFAAARDELAQVARRPDFARRIVEELPRARLYLGNGPLIARCRPELAQRLAESDSHLTVEQDAAAGAGVRLLTPDGAVEVDDTLEGRLERSRPSLTLAILKRLGGGAGAS